MNYQQMALDEFPLVAGMLYAVTYPVYYTADGSGAVSLLLLLAISVAAVGWATHAYSVCKVEFESVAGPKA